MTHLFRKQLRSYGSGNGGLTKTKQFHYKYFCLTARRIQDFLRIQAVECNSPKRTFGTLLLIAKTQKNWLTNFVAKIGVTLIRQYASYQQQFYVSGGNADEQKDKT